MRKKKIASTKNKIMRREEKQSANESHLGQKAKCMEIKMSKEMS